MNFLIENRNKLNNVLVYGIFVFLAVTGKMQNIGFTVLYSLLFFLNLNAFKKLILKDYLILLFFAFPLLIIIFDLIISPVDRWLEIRYFYETRLMCLIAPMTFLLLYKNNFELPKNAVYTYLVSLFIVLIIVFIKLDYTWIYSGESPDVFYFRFRTSMENAVNLHPTYLSMFLIFCSTYILFPGKISNKIVKYSIVAFVIIFLNLISVKISFIGLFFILLFYILKYKETRREYLILLFLIFVPVIVLGVSSNSRWSEIATTQTLDLNSVSIRKLIYLTDWMLLKEKWYVGLGMLGLREHMDAAFFQFTLIFKTDIGRYNTHNQYIEFILQYGIIGIFYILSVAYLWIKKIGYRNNPLLFLFVLIVGVFMLTENILNRQQGVLFIYTILPALFYFNIAKSNVIKKN